LKLRLLNGTHTLSCGLAFLARFQTVKDAMDDAAMSSFITEVMMKELAPSIPYEVSMDVARSFGNKVLDRFRNPHISHQWINITVQYTSKLKMRVIPILLKHYQSHASAPEFFTAGFAAYLLFLKPTREEGGKFYGELDGVEYPIQDDSAASFAKRWKALSPEGLVKEVLGDMTLWEADLNSLPHFYESVLEKLNLLMSNGAIALIESLQSKKVFV
jgi:tagaturonate reductase